MCLFAATHGASFLVSYLIHSQDHSQSECEVQVEGFEPPTVAGCKPTALTAELYLHNTCLIRHYM